jgi:hypothetical protein
MDQSKKLPLIIVAATILFILYWRFCGTGNEPKFEQIMKHTASELNKTCPQKVDNETQLDSASVHPDKRFRYNYSILFDKDSMEVEMFALSVKPLMLNNVRTNTDLQFFKDNNVIFEYYFRDVKGAFITRIEIAPDEYVTHEN